MFCIVLYTSLCEMLWQCNTFKGFWNAFNNIHFLRLCQSKLKHDFFRDSIYLSIQTRLFTTCPVINHVNPFPLLTRVYAPKLYFGGINPPTETLNILILLISYMLNDAYTVNQTTSFAFFDLFVSCFGYDICTC